MLELTTLAVFIGYLIYLRYYADQRTDAQKEADALREGITLYDTQKLAEALTYFNRVIQEKPASPVAYLYRARIYQLLGDSQASLTDLGRGKSYDDTIADLHLESGRIQYEAQAYQAAFQDFDKAIFYDHGQTAEPFRWRGLVRQHLGQLAAAEQDLAQAVRITERPPAPPKPTRSGPFVDRMLLFRTGLVVLNCAILLVIIRRSPVIHYPYFWAAASAVGLGFLEPKRGWVLAVLQAMLLLLGYYRLLEPDVLRTRREVELFGLFGSIGLTFAGSLIGSVLQKAQR